MFENSPRLDRLMWKLRPLKIVNLRWLAGLKLKNLGSDKIRVGFGHVHTDESTLTNRKWHIDPIVDGINRYSDRYVADIFFPYDHLSRFDIIVILKHIEFTTEEELLRLKRAGKKILYNISDNAPHYPYYYETATWFLDAVDVLLILNPLQGENIQGYADKFRTAAPPIIDDSHKTEYPGSGTVKLFWDGFAGNLFTLNRLVEIVKEVARSSARQVELIINSNVPEKDDGVIKYRTWSIKNWRTRMLDCDIGALIKPVENSFQQRKPATKLITYMGAGLPVVCTPSAADREVIEHGKTGFFAYTDEEWIHYLKMLIEDAPLRERMGRAAREAAVARFSIEQVTRQYTAIFDELMDNPSKTT